jgi:hypothetical protein
MAASIRISDSLYLAADQEAALMHRSLAMQVEHWASLGQALENTGIGLETIRAVAGGKEGRDSILRQIKQSYQEAGRLEVIEGRARASDLHLIPRNVARRATVIHKKNVSFRDKKTKPGKIKP